MDVFRIWLLVLMVSIGYQLVSVSKRAVRRNRQEEAKRAKREEAEAEAIRRAVRRNRQKEAKRAKREEAEAGREKEEVRKRKEESREWEERRREPVDPHQHRRRRDGTVVKGRTRRPKRSLERRPRKRTERGRK
ncbi:MAG: hypothetical protein F4X84_03245 [Synechococcus sp. SB0662_bin_45]|nr:hypothetical protein [Synechococcus sp. SB0668_bin_13]MYE21392.1 hypothetical protein [Synechococcus sp. SB0662_bin_45]